MIQRLFRFLSSLPNPHEFRQLDHQKVVPVFMYHAVKERYLKQDLKYLSENGYRTIGLDELVDWLKKRNGTHIEKGVVITFDDCHESLWTVAYPLLRYYGQTAVAFACPWWILEDGERINQRYSHPLAEMTNWEQLKTMDQSGIVDVQAHTWDHHRMWISSEIIGFIAPQQKCDYIWWHDGLRPEDDPQPPFGWPILPSSSRFGLRPRFMPEQEPFERCAEFVRGEGGVDFFKRQNWQDVLFQVLNGRNVAGCWETEVERREAIYNNLKQTKTVLEERLEKKIRHLVFPWNEAAQDSVAYAKEVGYHSICFRYINNRDICSLGDDPFAVPRVAANEAGWGPRLLSGRGQLSIKRLLFERSMYRLYR